VAIRVLVQAGHVAPREPGFEGGTGTIREQELTKAIRRRLVRLLHVDQRFQPVPCPGDIPDGASVEAALFLHGDGSTNAAASGYSFGFPIHAVNEKLAGLIDAEFQRIPGHPPHREDNYTGGLREYYGYRRVPTAGPEVLVEHGFLTNRREQSWIFKHLGPLANAEYRALCRFFDFAPRHRVAPGRPFGFAVADIDSGEERVVARELELSRAGDWLRDWGTRLRCIERMPIQPSPG
jgi:N-acetylmuramoyl-L-alanine amidase